MTKKDVDAVFNILYASYKSQKIFKNSNLIDREKQFEQLSNDLMNHLVIHWNHKAIKC